MTRAALAAFAALLLAAPATGAATQRVVGGTAAPDGAYPAQAYVRVRSDPNVLGVVTTFSCGGTLVGARKVVTAAHCLDEANFGSVPNANEDPVEPAQVTVFLGSNTRGQGTSHAVSTVALHPAYDPQTSADDAAVLTLSVAATEAALPLADPADAPDYAVGKLARVIGWGATASGGNAVDQLQEVDVPIQSDLDCNDANSYNGTLVPDVQMCAGYPQGGKDSCQGDSGGPLMVPADGVFKLVGVVSFGDGCGQPDKYGVYSELPAAPLRSFLLSAAGTPPTIAIDDPGTATRGSATTLRATANDPTEGGGVAAPTWDLDGDGAFDDATGANVSWTPPEAGTFPVRARVVDTDGMVGVTERTVTVAPAASDGAGRGDQGTGSGGGSGAGTGTGGTTGGGAGGAGTSGSGTAAPGARPQVRTTPLLVVSAKGTRALRVRGTVGGAGCAGGVVRVSTYRRTQLLGRKTVTLPAGCAFAASVPATGRVTVKVRFLGTVTLLPVSVTKVRRVPTRT